VRTGWLQCARVAGCCVEGGLGALKQKGHARHRNKKTTGTARALMWLSGARRVSRQVPGVDAGHCGQLRLDCTTASGAAQAACGPHLRVRWVTDGAVDDNDARKAHQRASHGPGMVPPCAKGVTEPCAPAPLPLNLSTGPPTRRCLRSCCRPRAPGSDASTPAIVPWAPRGDACAPAMVPEVSCGYACSPAPGAARNCANGNPAVRRSHRSARGGTGRG